MNKKILEEYFSFTKKERVAVLTLVLVIIAVAVMPAFFPSAKPEPDAATVNQWKKDVATLSAMKKDSFNDVQRFSVKRQRFSAADTQSASNYTLFVFDPNIISEDDWQKLGLSKRTIQTIIKYRSKGGHFRKPEDLGKIYGLNEKEYHRLLPYVRIGNDAPGFVSKGSKALENDHSYTPRTESRMSVEINRADSNAFIALPGIGSKLAARIISFRIKLGGFYSVSQVAETYGLADSVFQKIAERLTCDAANITKININQADAGTLKQHPYFTWPVANGIVQYRQQHGNFSSLDQLHQVAAIRPDDLKRILPYLTLK